MHILKLPSATVLKYSIAVAAWMSLITIVPACSGTKVVDGNSAETISANTACINCPSIDGLVIEEGSSMSNDVTGSYFRLAPGELPNAKYSESHYVRASTAKFGQSVTLSMKKSTGSLFALAETCQHPHVLAHISNELSLPDGTKATTNQLIITPIGSDALVNGAVQFSITNPGKFQAVCLDSVLPTMSVTVDAPPKRFDEASILSASNVTMTAGTGAITATAADVAEEDAIGILIVTAVENSNVRLLYGSKATRSSTGSALVATVAGLPAGEYLARFYLITGDLLGLTSLENPTATAELTVTEASAGDLFNYLTAEATIDASSVGTIQVLRGSNMGTAGELKPIMDIYAPILVSGSEGPAIKFPQPGSLDSVATAQAIPNRLEFCSTFTITGASNVRESGVIGQAHLYPNGGQSSQLDPLYTIIGLHVETHPELNNTITLNAFYTLGDESFVHQGTPISIQINSGSMHTFLYGAKAKACLSDRGTHVQLSISYDEQAASILAAVEKSEAQRMFLCRPELLPGDGKDGYRNGNTVACGRLGMGALSDYTNQTGSTLLLRGFTIRDLDPSGDESH